MISETLAPAGGGAVKSTGHPAGAGERLCRTGFLIWAGVGLVVVGLHLPVPFGPWADFVFMAWAALVVLWERGRTLGWGRAAAGFAWVAVTAGVIETVGHETGAIFGAYVYTDAFGPRAGVLPLAIPLAWWVVLVPLLTAARAWLPGRALAVAAAAAACVAVDLVIEPVAWHLRGYWHWQGPGSWWYGVPAQNFAGWAATAAFIGAGLVLLWPPRPPRILDPSLALPTPVMVGTFLLALLTAGYWWAAALALALLWGWTRLWLAARPPARTPPR